MTAALTATPTANLGAAAGGLHFVYKTVRGNGTIVARVNGAGSTSAAAEAGLLVRTDTSTTSPYVDLHVTGDGEAALEFRKTSGGAIKSSAPVDVGGPVWLKLTRDGNSFAGYVSASGADGTWRLVGTAGVPIGTFAQFGLAAGGAANAATFSGVAVTPAVGLGGNLDFQSDRVQDLPFIDLVKTTRGFYNVAGRVAANGFPAFAATDANGWPTEDFTFAAVDNTEWGVDVRPGVYKMAFTGPAGVAVAAAGGVGVSQTSFDAGSGAYTYDVTVPAGVKKLQLTVTGTGGGVRGVRLLQPGYALAGAQVFTDAYLNLLRTVGPNTLRLMDWVQTNNNPIANWADRTEPTDATQTKAANPGDLQAQKGIAWEYAVALANAVHKSVWINIPAKATDDYVRQLATLLKNNLDPDLNIYVEYSNEVWNAGFTQHQTNLDAAKAEVAANPSSNLKDGGVTDSNVWALRRFARRVKEIGDTFRTVWTGAGLDDPTNTRVRVVLGGLVGTTGLGQFDTELAYLNKFYGAPKNYLYGIGIAPYANMGSQQNTAGLTKDQVLSALSAGVDRNLTAISNAFTKANTNGIKLLAYEGGFDTFGDASIAAKAAAVLDPQIQAIMTRYLNGWYARGGEQFNWFTVGARSYNTPYGTWAITDSLDRLNSPKIQGFQQIRDALPAAVTTGVVYG